MPIYLKYVAKLLRNIQINVYKREIFFSILLKELRQP